MIPAASFNPNRCIHPEIIFSALLRPSCPPGCRGTNSRCVENDKIQPESLLRLSRHAPGVSPMSPSDESPFNKPGLNAEEIFEILVAEHTPMLTAYLRSRLWQKDVVEDVFQETMMVAWRRLGDFDRTRLFGPWLRGIANRLVMAQRRKHGRDMLNSQPEVIEILEERFNRIQQLEGDGFRDKIKKLRTCLKQLPDPMREVIELSYGRGMLLKEISSAIGSSTEATKKRIQRARQRIAECIESGAAS